jgi:uncharacterized membrane protein
MGLGMRFPALLTRRPVFRLLTLATALCAPISVVEAGDVLALRAETETRVDIRAAGYTPDWTFALDREGRMSFESERAQPVVVLTTPVSGSPALSGGMIYGARTEAEELVAEVATTGCTDARSGERLTHYVTIRLNGQEYHGCGKATGVPAR